jgi:hypothetical protein
MKFFALIGARDGRGVPRKDTTLKRDVALKLMPEPLPGARNAWLDSSGNRVYTVRQLGSKVEVPEKGMEWTQLDELS